MIIATPAMKLTEHKFGFVRIKVIWAQPWALQATVLKTSLGTIILCTTKTRSWTSYLYTYLLSAACSYLASSNATG